MYSGPYDQSTPDPLSLLEDTEASSAILEETQQIREDNQRLQLTMMEMQRQLNASRGPDLPLSTPSPSIVYSPHIQPAVHTTALRPPCPAPQDMAHYTSVLVHVFSREEVEGGDWPFPHPSVVEEDRKLVSVAEVTACLMRMGMSPEQPSRIQMPDYCEPIVLGSLVSCLGWHGSANQLFCYWFCRKRSYVQAARFCCRLL